MNLPVTVTTDVPLRTVTSASTLWADAFVSICKQRSGTNNTAYNVRVGFDIENGLELN
jgi:hypothetical protein